MQWRHQSMRIALRDTNKTGVEIGESQNRCHDDSFIIDYCKFVLLQLTSLITCEHIFACINHNIYFKWFLYFYSQTSQTLYKNIKHEFL